ncbi:MAG TPA: malto-oligosyltrehalose trehalohydrolase [Verrucomicrobiae bacterium]
MNTNSRTPLEEKPGAVSTLKTQSSGDNFPRRLPIGAEVGSSGVHFRVWAPKSKRASVLISETADLSRTAWLAEMEPERDGYFSLLVPDASPGLFYKFRLDSGDFPDPVSRFQPEGPHGPSQIIDPASYPWKDANWRGAPRAGQVIYEMHLGTFTKEGTFAAAAEQLPKLAELGITLLELMPVADFPGRFGWGYDGVNLFAPTRLYGRPDDLRFFVDRAHHFRLGVILDVVYNHIGPDGNYLKHFSTDYFSHRYSNEWGEALNFDGENSEPVREFFISNARYWIDEFHLDGLRLDATQQIFDSSAKHIVQEIGQAVRVAGAGRATYIVAENESQESGLVRSVSAGGYGLDALWNDDFHHTAKVALAGRGEAYYSDYRGTPQEILSAIKWGYLFQGQRYAWQKKPRGKPALDLHPEQFVIFLENHDQIANSLHGTRVHQRTSPGRFRAFTALVLLGPNTPMLFQGQEFAASAPFFYFADHNPELAKLVSKGRREFLSQFASITTSEAQCMLVDPELESTFRRCKLDFSERETHGEVSNLHRDLLRLRREDPVLSRPKRLGVDGAVLGPEAFVVRFFAEDGQDRLLLVNLGCDLRLDSVAEPLLAPPEQCRWKVEWSSESCLYGGGGTPPIEVEGSWFILGQAAVLMSPEPEGKNGKAGPQN